MFFKIRLSLSCEENEDKSSYLLKKNYKRSLRIEVSYVINILFKLLVIRKSLNLCVSMNIDGYKKTHLA